MQWSERERGAATMEYVAVVVFIAMITGGLAFTDIPGRVADACVTAICRIIGGDDCEASDTTPSPGATPEQEEPPASSAPDSQQPARPPISKPTCRSGADLPQSGGFELHAHNDYENGDPLDDALDHGATSVEADVYLDGDDLVLKHGTGVLDGNTRGTLADQYIDGLRDRADENDGEIYPGRTEPFTLVIEIKEEGAKAAEAYDRALEQIRDLPDGVEVVFSGGYPAERSYDDWANAGDSEIGRQPPNVSFDIAPEEGCTFPPELDPAGPDYRPDFAQHFSTFNANWEDCEHLSQQELNELIQKAHNAGLKTRFWGGPDDSARLPRRPGEFVPCPGFGGCQDAAEKTREAWRRQMEAGVDYVNTNHLGKGQTWIESCGDDY